MQRTRAATEAMFLPLKHAADDLGYVGESIQLVTRALAGKVPVIGFTGAPFTLASYMIEGGPSRNFLHTKRLMYSDETLWRRLMGKIVDVLGPFAIMQVASGARCIQVFDSWVGALSPDDYVDRVRCGEVVALDVGTQDGLQPGSEFRREHQHREHERVAAPIGAP